MPRAVHLRLAAAAVFTLMGAAGCRPPATDDYVDRTRLATVRDAPSAPILSPDVEGATWAVSGKAPDRLLYGKPGAAPLMALECEIAQGTVPMLGFTRFARADAGAKGILALIGNGHVERLFVDAAKQPNGAWLWQGRLPAEDPRLEVLTGSREIEATVPGAGSVKLHPSALPGELVNRCRAAATASPAPEPVPSAPAGPG